MTVQLSKLLNPKALRRMAGEVSFERGEEYFSSGRVQGLLEHAGTLTAKVEGQGHLEYRVKIWLEKRHLDFSCSCPVGLEGSFCKHCVAVGLAWLKTVEGVANGSAQQPANLKEVEAALAAKPKEALIKMLLERAMDDDLLRQRLVLEAVKQERGRINFAAYRRAIDEATDPGGFVDWKEVQGLAQAMYEATDAIEGLAKDGHSEEAIELAEYALKAVEGTLQTVDDSNGLIREVLERLEHIHLIACLQARPDPEKLAQRLFQWELDAPFDTFYEASRTYAQALGEKGLATYRKLAEAAWTKVPSVGPGGRKEFGSHFRITHIMETLARQSGDVEAVVAVKKRDLSSAYDFLKIAQTYQEAGKPDLALEWAEKGLQAFPKQTDARLRRFLAEEYQRRKRYDDEMSVVWADYADRPGFDFYKVLKVHADHCGQWSLWRDKALALLNEGIAKARIAAAKNSWDWTLRAAQSELVAIYLWERNPEAAWDAAKSGGCSDELWLKLAALRESKHPEDALAVYRSHVEPRLALKHNEGYRQAVEFLRKIQTLMIRLGRREEFIRYLESVRLAHKPKRNFIQMLEARKWI